MWKVKETEQIGTKTFWQVYKPRQDKDAEIRGRYEYKEEAEKLADKLNKEDGYYERLQ